MVKNFLCMIKSKHWKMFPQSILKSLNKDGRNRSEICLLFELNYEGIGCLDII